MIHKIEQLFWLETKDTTYAFQVLPSGHLEHLYYGRRIPFVPEKQQVLHVLDALREKKEFLPGNALAYSKDYPNLGLEDLCLEMSSYGKGDIREPFVELVYADGSSTCDFLYSSFQIENGKKELLTLPAAYDDTQSAQTLKITLTEPHQVKLELCYTIFPECDVIVRSSKLINESELPVKVKRLMSAQLDFDSNGYCFTTFQGAWAREMNRCDQIVNSGMYVNGTAAGTSSNRANPFVMVSNPDTTEDMGQCIGCNLIYSGSHYESFSVNSYGKSRLVTGIQPVSFLWNLETGASLESPEAVFTFSAEGFNCLSHNMHLFVKEHIVRGEWKYKERPVLLNSWEASYFDFNEKKLLKLAKAGKEAGIELFVLDDGWFGKRNNDTSSLGDWIVNTKKLPGGLKRLADKIKALGMDFGIWIEPEMVNEDSDCYRKHPDWAVRIPNREHSTGRNQMILDLTRQEVRLYLYESIKAVLESADISYVKWDMNRIFSDQYSVELPANRQGEFIHRYVCGLAILLKQLTEAFPHILWEGCASGGNRFDLGILCYMPQIWASDNTDAICRTTIQQGYSYGYPPSVISAHVSDCPNHQTLRNTPLATRFAVASFGILGYECNLGEMKKEELKSIKEQIVLYKKWRNTLQFGRFYRLEEVLQKEPFHKNQDTGSYQWLMVSKGQEKAVGMMVHTKVIPNAVYEKFRTRGLDERMLYHVTNLPFQVNIKEFGGLINMIAPVHIKKDSLLHETVAKVVKMDSETEDYKVSGSLLNFAGIKLKQGFGGTGYNEQVRLYQDYHARLYFFEEIHSETDKYISK